MDNFGPFNKCAKYVQKFMRKYLRINFLCHLVLNMFTAEKYLCYNLKRLMAESLEETAAEG